MSAEEVSFPVEPHPLAGIGVHAGGRIHKTVAVVNCKVDEAVMRKCIVTTPLISEDRCTRSHTLFYQSDEGVVVTSIIRTLHKKALSSGTTESTKYPLAKDSSAAIDESKLPNLDSSISIRCPGPPIFVGLPPVPRRSSAMQRRRDVKRCLTVAARSDRSLAQLQTLTPLQNSQSRCRNPEKGIFRV